MKLQKHSDDCWPQSRASAWFARPARWPMEPAGAAKDVALRPGGVLGWAGDRSARRGPSRLGRFDSARRTRSGPHHDRCERHFRRAGSARRPVSNHDARRSELLPLVGRRHGAAGGDRRGRGRDGPGSGPRPMGSAGHSYGGRWLDWVRSHPYITAGIVAAAIATPLAIAATMTTTTVRTARLDHCHRLAARDAVPALPSQFAIAPRTRGAFLLRLARPMGWQRRTIALSSHPPATTIRGPFLSSVLTGEMHMVASRTWGRVLAALAIVGFVPAGRSRRPPKTPRRLERPVIRDVELAYGGLLVGRLLDANGQPLGNARRVGTLGRQNAGRDADRCRRRVRRVESSRRRASDHHDRQRASLPPVGQRHRPAAAPQVDRRGVRRATWSAANTARRRETACGKKAKVWATNPFIVGGVVAAAVAIPVALSDDDGPHS